MSKIKRNMVSFGNASGPLDPIIVSKSLQPKGIYFVRPAMNQYFTNSEEIQEAANMLFKQILSGNVKIEIFKNTCPSSYFNFSCAGIYLCRRSNAY